MSRDDAIALLRLAGLDAELDRLRQCMAAVLEPLARQREGLVAFAELIEKDRSQRTARESGEALQAWRHRLLRNQRTHGELEGALKRDESDVLEMSRELQGKAAWLAEERGAVLARVSLPLGDRYEAAVREGQQPVLAALDDNRCSGCGEALPSASRRLVQERLCVVPCSGCLRLIYDRGRIGS